MEKRTEKEQAVERLLQKVNLVAENSNTLTWDLRLFSLKGDEIHRLKDNLSKDTEKKEKQEILCKSLRESLDMYPEAYSVTGFVGPYTNKSNRTQFREIVNPELIRTMSEEEEEGESFIPAPVVSGTQQSQKQTVMNTNYSDKDAFELMCGIFPKDGLGNPETLAKDPRTQFFLQVQEFKLKSDMQIEKLSGIVDSDKDTIARINARLEVLEKENAKLRNDNERQKKYIEKIRPQLEEAEKLKTKNGQIANLAGSVLSGIALNFVAGTKYGALLGLGGQDDQQQQPQQPQQPQEEDGENYEVEQTNE